MATGGGEFSRNVEEIDSTVRIPTPNANDTRGYGDDKPETQDKESDKDSRSRTTDPSDLQPSRSPDGVKELERKFRYLKFQDYDFNNDEQFQIGWKKLSGVVPADQFDHQFLKAKLFYYSKHNESLDVNGYLAWKETRPRKTESTEPTPAPQEDSDGHRKGDNSCSSNVPASSSNTEMSLTFSDVIELIQGGKPIPGLKTLDIIPTESDPSPSVLERKTKPWES